MRRLLTLTALLALASCAATTQSSLAPSFSVFFTERSSALEPTALDVIAQAANAAKAAPDRSVVVLGWTDSVGSKPDDVVLSQQRAARVANALVADGVAATRITRHGRGQTGIDLASKAAAWMSSFQIDAKIQ